MDMNQVEFQQFFSDSLNRNNITPFSEEQIDTFYSFTELLLEVNSHTNLTAIRDTPSIIEKHYTDSLMVEHLLPEGARVLDLGCGPGFPSIPLAVARPDLTIVALDSTAKKIQFVQNAAKSLGISNLSAISGRAEDISIRNRLQKFDFVVSRAVARLNILCELCLPYLKIGGSLVALKGAKYQEEADEAQNAIHILGGAPPIIDQVPLLTSGGKEARASIIIQLISPTPAQYPRPYASILKKPL